MRLEISSKSLLVWVLVVAKMFDIFILCSDMNHQDVRDRRFQIFLQIYLLFKTYKEVGWVAIGVIIHAKPPKWLNRIDGNEP